MKGEVVQNIYNLAIGAEWVLVRTNQGLYSMRLGGFKKETDMEILTGHKELVFPFKNRRIQEIYTDEEWVYLILSEGGVIASGWIDVDCLGEMKLGVEFRDVGDYEFDFFKSSLFLELTMGYDGWSKLV